jgi:hypothetical protein
MKYDDPMLGVGFVLILIILGIFATIFPEKPDEPK